VNEERKKRLLRRVEKLLRQADGTSYKEEAETALLMAQRILCEHGMTMEEVDALSHEEQKTLVANEQMVTMGHRHSEWLLNLARVLCRQFRCKHYINHTGGGQQKKHHIRIVGLAEDVAVCRDVYAYARQTAERLAKAYAKQPGVVMDHIISKDYWYRYCEPTPAQKAAANKEVQALWKEGFIKGLQDKFREQVERSESMAVMLTIHPVVQDAYKDLGLGKSRFRPQAIRAENGAARQAGYEAGRAFQPQRPERIGAPTPRLPAAR
jgi:Protein of unknown function (DUF2786)